MGMNLMIKADTAQLSAFAEKLEKLNGDQKEKFMQHALREMAGRLLALVIPATPVGTGSMDADGGTTGVGGNLRRGWIGGGGGSSTPSAPEISAFADAMSVQKTGGGYGITVANNVYYASYVELGHRQTPGRYVPAIGKRLVKSWVEGKHFLKLSEEQLSAAAPTVLQNLLDAWLREVLG